ncbi:MAG: hypothetical protein HOI95_20930 [Chromatiales bacterium]|jgi:hypothetical protein|nr:hypothetical protein [Chromatiales bacterium]
MKVKLTITVDEDLVPAAKNFARSRGVSLSQLIEDNLRSATAEERPSFSRRWRGKFKRSDRSDERYEQLSKKYL